MKSRYTRPLVALGVVAALAFPGMAVAKGGGHGHGKGGRHGQAADQPDGHGHGKGKGKGPKGRALNIKGTVAAVGDGTIDVVVNHSNHHGRALRGKTVTVDVSDARIRVRDVNGDGSRDLGDVNVGDRVLVQSRIKKGEQPDPTAPLVAKRVVDKGPKPASGDSGAPDDSGTTGDTGGDSGDPGDDAGGDSGDSPTP